MVGNGMRRGESVKRGESRGKGKGGLAHPLQNVDQPPGVDGTEAFHLLNQVPQKSTKT